ncbi:MAG TPA: hypothetical protein VHA82_17130 [Ramlibacter sp.]|uniref:hypothetical protein n=1 Tax=Ramlibacter sp. TaxID=1917967 RepID=UPI002CE3E505|nr:hypothetical protein [Ramlibacter sp.]HVZ45537.1 hypothetical protein [Ramlibacter sp.]
MERISQWFLRLAVLYLVLGIVLGNVMGMSGDHSMMPVHVHLNLLGWVTMGLFGLFYRAWPAAGMTKLAKLQFWIYVPSHFVQMVSLSLLYRGVVSIEPLLGISSLVVGIAIIMFAVVLWRATGVATDPAKAAMMAEGVRPAG